jgi:hypothetical protein
MNFKFDKSKTALMIMDYQIAIVDMVPEAPTQTPLGLLGCYLGLGRRMA